MNMPENVMIAVKQNSERREEAIKKEKVSIFDKISSSYIAIEADIEEKVERIKSLRSDADRIKAEIDLKKNISDDAENIKYESDQFEQKIESNNSLIKNKTCVTVVDLISEIKSSISKDSKTAKNLITPLEESVDLLKMQVKYTMILEETLDVFNEKEKIEKRKEEVDQIIAMLKESMNI